MAKNAVYEGNREVRTFVDLNHGAKVLILKTKENEAGAVHVVMPKDIVDGSIRFETTALITAERAEPLQKHLLREGDVLFARRGDLSKIAVYSESDNSAICGTGCLRLRPNVDEIDLLFLRYLFANDANVEWLKRNAVGVTMPNLNTEIIGRMPVILPSISEQHRIAEVLCSFDDVIAVQNELLGQQLCSKAGLMDDLLRGKVRTM